MKDNYEDDEEESYVNSISNQQDNPLSDKGYR